MTRQRIPIAEVDPKLAARAFRAIETLENQLAEVSKKYRERIKRLDSMHRELISRQLDGDMLPIKSVPTISEEMEALIENPTAGL